MPHVGDRKGAIEGRNVVGAAVAPKDRPHIEVVGIGPRRVTCLRLAGFEHVCPA